MIEKEEIKKIICTLKKRYYDDKIDQMSSTFYKKEYLYTNDLQEVQDLFKKIIKTSGTEKYKIEDNGEITLWYTYEILNYFITEINN